MSPTRATCPTNFTFYVESVELYWVNIIFKFRVCNKFSELITTVLCNNCVRRLIL